MELNIVCLMRKYDDNTTINDNDDGKNDYDNDKNTKV